MTRPLPEVHAVNLRLSQSADGFAIEAEELHVGGIATARRLGFKG